MRMSARSARSSTISGPRADLRSTVTERLLRLVMSWAGSMPRPAPAGRSTRTTSAPRSASTIAAYGPGPMPASSTTRTPVSGPCGVAVIRPPRRYNNFAVTPLMLRTCSSFHKPSGRRVRTGRRPTYRRVSPLSPKPVESGGRRPPPSRDSATPRAVEWHRASRGPCGCRRRPAAQGRSGRGGHGSRSPAGARQGATVRTSAAPLSGRNARTAPLEPARPGRPVAQRAAAPRAPRASRREGGRRQRLPGPVGHRAPPLRAGRPRRPDPTDRRNTSRRLVEPLEGPAPRAPGRRLTPAGWLPAVRRRR